MGRLKKEHRGWGTSGLWLKYKQTTANEQLLKGKSKKDTNKWCRGKVGVEHQWNRFQQKRWDDEQWAFMSTYVEVECVVCHKEKHLKTAKSLIYPLHAFVEYDNLGYQSIQVKVNGKVLPIEEYQYHSDKYWCKHCKSWHKS